MYDRWLPKIVIAEENSIGSNPNIEVLIQEGLPILGFNTKSASKTPLSESYALSIEQRDIETPDNGILTGLLALNLAASET